MLFQSFNSKIKMSGEIPDDISKVITTSCYDCHSSDAKSKDAKDALNFETWDDYRLTKKVGLLKDICKMVEEGKMPPEKYLGFKPDRKLSEESKKLLCEWTNKETERLMEGN